MDPTHFIIGLMRENTNALGFIPAPTVVKQFVSKGRFILQLNLFRKPIGYLLHGPTHPDGHMHIAQACIQLDKRSRGFGSAVVQQLISRAAAARATDIFLRCALDLDACIFWRTAGFNPIEILPGGLRRRRTIIRFQYELQQSFSPIVHLTPQKVHSARLKGPHRSAAPPRGRISAE